ncbi:hypothetical protein KSZ_30280 [Dictyobacter formicarum]|uniref:Uncharacterized protein n=1 Tax=Dictyobacter formicarum TaxID=2778368 RepID=A0ABQ3VFT0_9CHLR|nr:hypothetical protein KSZ_30280 [Dictyobacter formicarum]
MDERHERATNIQTQHNSIISNPYCGWDGKVTGNEELYAIHVAVTMLNCTIHMTSIITSRN